MYRKVITVFFIFLIGFVFSQNKSFVYELKYKPNPSKDSLATAKYILDISDGKSMFRTLRDRETDSTFHATRRLNFMTTSFKDYNAVYKNSKSKETLKFITNFQKLFSLKIEEELVWTIEAEKKSILGMQAQKAISSYGGRTWIAWFTTEIPLQEGPYIFHGLPGLIIEITDTENNYSFSLIQIKNSDGNLYEKDNALPISWKQYEKLALDYYSDPTREINGKNSGSTVKITKWQDENGIEFTPNFKEWNEKEQRVIRTNNNPIELNHLIKYP